MGQFSWTSVMMIKVLIADNQPLTAAGLTSILGEKEDLMIVDQVSSRERLPELLESRKPDLLIVDYNTSGYITKDDLVAVKERSPETNVLVISSDDDKASILQ